MWHRAIVVVMIAAAAAPLACRRDVAPPAPATPPRVPVVASSGRAAFVDVTAASGIDFRYRNGEEADRYAILESLGGGVGLIDFDRDGLLDIFVTGGGYFDGDALKGHPSRLYKNLGEFRFRDVTADVGLPADGAFYSHGCAVGDYDGDGWPDLLVTGYGGLALYRNVEGRKFIDVTRAAGLKLASDVHWATSALWADLDGDGQVDLFVPHYVKWSPSHNPRCRGYGPDQPIDICPPNRFEALPPQLFLNRGNGAFR